MASRGGGEAGQRAAWQQVDSGRENRAKASLLSLFPTQEGNKAVSPEHIWKFTGATIWRCVVGPGLVSQLSTRSCRHWVCGGRGGLQGTGRAHRLQGAGAGVRPCTECQSTGKAWTEQKPMAQGGCTGSRKGTRGSFPGSWTTETKRLSEVQHKH